MATGGEQLTEEERARLAPHFTTLDGPVFALTNLPEVVKGALFARYSRSPKPLRRLFLDEFADGETSVTPATSIGVDRAARLYKRVFDEYGDDSVAQLGGVHLACENVSNILTKVLEWGRLMAYLEQSTRYIPYTDRPGGRWRYHVPEELDGLPALRERYVATLDHAFETYTKWLDPLQAYLARRASRGSIDDESAYGSSIKAKALDALRGLLPAATLANVGLYGTAQAYEALLLRLRRHPLAEARRLYGQILKELKVVIPDFLRRVERLQSGGDEWSTYLRETSDATRAVGNRLLAGAEAEERDEVTLTDFDSEGEVKVVAAALYALCDLPDDQLLTQARKMSPEDRERVLRAYVG
jgi:thymidylate synthase ThyX